jgi:hypothetical protein
LAQALSTYSQSFYPGFTKGFADIRIAFWFVPMGMALFLKQDSGYSAFDWLANIDFTQAVLFWVSAYVCFVRMPWESRPSTSAHLQPLGLAPAFAAVLWSETTVPTQGLSHFLGPDTLQGKAPQAGLSLLKPSCDGGCRLSVRCAFFVQRIMQIVVEFAEDANYDLAPMAFPGVRVTKVSGALAAQIACLFLTT